MSNGTRRFRIALLGFNKRDVTSYLSTIFDETERVLEGNERKLGKIITDAETQAQLRACAIIQEAENRAKAIIEQAEEYASSIKRENESIKNHNIELIEGAEKALQKLKGDIYRLQND